MKPEEYQEQLRQEEIKVMAYEGKIPCKPHIWFCPRCLNMNIDRYKRATLICDHCKRQFCGGK